MHIIGNYTGRSTQQKFKYSIEKKTINKKNNNPSKQATKLNKNVLLNWK